MTRFDAVSSATDVTLPDRTKVLIEGMGYKGWSFDPAMAGATLVPLPTSANAGLYGTLVPLVAGDVVTNLYIELGSPASNVTLAKMAVFNAAGSTRQGITADFSTAMNAVTLAIFPAAGAALTSPFTVVTTGDYWFTFMNMGTTGATLKRQNMLNNARPKGTNPPRAHFNQSSYSDIPTSFTPSGISSAIWFGWD